MKSARLSAGGTANNRAQRANTQRDPYPLPAQSLRADPLADAERSRASGIAVTVFLSLLFAFPMICIGIILHFR